MQNLEISIFAMQKYWNFKIWHIESWNFKIWHANYLQWPPLPSMWITLFIHKLHSYLEETHICLDSNICLLIQDTVDKKIKTSGDNQETFDSMYLRWKGGFFWCSLSRRRSFGSSRNSAQRGTGTRDEPLRASVWEATFCAPESTL